MLRDVAFLVRQTLASRSRRHFANALDTHGTVVGGLIQLVAEMHLQVAKKAHIVV